MYMPVLKVKGGELSALKASQVELLSPLLELVPPKPADDPAKVIQTRAKEIARAWRHEIRVDVLQFVAAVGEVLPSGVHVLDALDTALMSHGVPLIPVTGLGRTATFQTAAAGVAARRGRGAALRLQASDLQRPGLAQGYALQAATDLGLPATGIDLILDLQGVAPATMASLATAADHTLTALYATPTGAAAPAWRACYVVAGGYPVNPSGVAPGSVTPLPRADWQLWSTHTFPVATVYGDYGVDSPAFPGTGGRAFSNIKYTTDQDWLFIRGINVTMPGGRSQFLANCKILTARPEFKGAAFSKGDTFIANTCTAGATQGNPQQWRAAMYSHHIAFVLDQLRGHGAAAPVRHGPPAPPLPAPGVKKAKGASKTPKGPKAPAARASKSKS
ncbi:beta family protein [Deinococcus multiflagellatus]|uniref:Beta family protein n=1 Tax=Deinococcus multiflagellatus TaxID=1656887 RepID=A0ABW1ZQ54_9DEIO|nr:beta family protein [Deinococcus multiflagellatus]MBZ9715555.1 beta family protein [Deinococcus multiflagellatus]